MPFSVLFFFFWGKWASVTALKVLRGPMQHFLGPSFTEVAVPVNCSFFEALHAGEVHSDIFIQLPAELEEEIPAPIFSLLRLYLRAKRPFFPGPMSSPFRKSHIPFVKSTTFTVMEKSDGIRALIVGYQAKAFPVWREGVQRKVLTNSFTTICQLENAVSGLGSGSSSTITLGGNEFQLSSADTPDHYRLISGEKSIECIRGVEAQLLLYALDRSMKGLFLLDCIFQTESIEAFVADAELLHSPAPPVLSLLAFFDLYGLRLTEQRETLAMGEPTSKRVAHMNSLMEQLVSTTPVYSSSSCRLYAKRMVFLEDIDQILEKITYDAEAKKYFFEGPFGRTGNDGLVFTPEKFQYSSGSKAAQLKWKWCESLSVDWKVYGSGVEGVYYALMHVHKKRLPLADDIDGHWRIYRPIPLGNPNRLTIPESKEDAVVVECRYDLEKGMWSMMRLRTDKTVANSLVTVISVFESVSEGLNLPYLLQHLLPEKMFPQEILNLERPLLRNKAMKIFKGKECYALFTLQVRNKDGQHKVYLQWCTNNTNSEYPKPVFVPVCEVCECSGLGFPRPQNGLNLELQNLLLLQIANHGGTYGWSDYVVEAMFDAEKGHWVITKLQPDERKNYMCSFDYVLKHLIDAIGKKNQTHIYQQKKLPLLQCRNAQGSDTAMTNEHYGEKVVELGGKKRSALRERNNLVKSSQIQWCSSTVRASLGMERIRVFDICCGRGGDLTKWAHQALSYLFMVDASLECVAEAAARYSSGKGMSLRCNPRGGFPATFGVFDAFDREGKSLARALTSTVVAHGEFHIVSCQFSIHYGCRTQDNLDYFLSYVAKSLTEGGLFIGSTVKDTTVVDIFFQHGPEYKSSNFALSFPPESVASISKCKELGQELDFGIRYSITVEDSVSNLPEYIVPWKKFCDLCEVHSLSLVYCKDFLEYCDANRDEMEALSTACAGGCRKRSREMLDAFEADELSRLYTVFAFKKKITLIE